MKQIYIIALCVLIGASSAFAAAGRKFLVK